MMTRARRDRWRTLLLGIVAVALLATATPAVGADGLIINGGASATNDPALTLSLQPPVDAVTVQVAFDEAFQLSTQGPAAPQVLVTIPTIGPEERTVRVWVRYRDVNGQFVGPTLTETIIFDTLPPALGTVTFTQLDQILVCTPTGPDIGGTNRTFLGFQIQVTLTEAGSGTAQFEIVDQTSTPTGWISAPGSFSLNATPGKPLGIHTRDALGNVSALVAIVPPTAALTVVPPSQFPFLAAIDCPRQSPVRWNKTVRSAWAQSGRKAKNKDRVASPPSALAWTFYQDNGDIALNWVIAGTELKRLLGRQRMDDYRAGVSEVVRLSTVGRSERKRVYRINENWFKNPGAKQGIPWRDGMGTAVLLASLAPALRADAPRREQDLAVRVATEYLETFSVDWRRGGVLWRDSGPGQWFLEYTYLPENRVLNGSMQAVVSLNRFATQAEELGRSASPNAAQWRALASRARTHVLKAATSLKYWLPSYDLPGGKTRYSLKSGPAPPFYIGYHQELLGLLATITYVPRPTRLMFMNYRVRWGGTRLPVP